MNRRFGRAVISVGLFLVWAPLAQAETQAPPPPPAGQQQPGTQTPAPRFWWRDEHYQKHLALTSDQVTRLEAIWQAALPDLRKGRDELDRQEAELSRLIEMNADETVVTHQVDKVEQIRSHLNKARTLMLLHHRQLLTPEQRVKLKAMRDRDRERAGAAPAPAPTTGGQRP
jgi:Spy/CpxP family protein refolding chaperone